MSIFSLNSRWETERTYLRAPSEEDIQVIWSASRYEGFNDGITWDQPSSLDELRDAHIRTLRKWTDGSEYTWTMVNAAANTMIGQFGIYSSETTGIWSIGYWVHPTSQGQGYAKEGAKALLALTFNHLGAEKVIASHATWNDASGRVLKHIGMRVVGTTEQGYIKHGNWIPEYNYAIQKSEYDELNKASHDGA